MDVVGTVDRTVAHVDAVEDSVVVAVERAANTIDNDDSVDVQIIAYRVVFGFKPATLDTVACSCLVGIGSGLIGVGAAVAHVDRVGHEVAIVVWAAEDGKVLHWLSVFELAVVLKLSTTGVDGAVIEVVGHTIKIEVGAAVSRCELSGGRVLNANGGIGTRATIETIGHAIEISIKGLAGGRIITRIGAARVADTTLGVLADSHGGTDIVLVIPDAAGALIEDVGDTILICRNNNERKQSM